MELTDENKEEITVLLSEMREYTEAGYAVLSDVFDTRIARIQEILVAKE